MQAKNFEPKLNIKCLQTALYLDVTAFFTLHTGRSPLLIGFCLIHWGGGEKLEKVVETIFEVVFANLPLITHHLSTLLANEITKNA